MADENIQFIHKESISCLPASLAPEHSQPVLGAPYPSYYPGTMAVGLKEQGSLQPCSCGQAPNCLRKVIHFLCPCSRLSKVRSSAAAPLCPRHLPSAAAMSCTKDNLSLEFHYFKMFHWKQIPSINQMC